MSSSDEEADVPNAFVNESYVQDKHETNQNDRAKSVKKASVEEEIDEDEQKGYGYGSCQPGFLQWLNSPRGYLFCLCAYCFIQGMTVNGIIYTIITTLERRFNLSSVQSAFISSSYDFCAMFFVVFVTYFGERGHKPRLIGIGAFIFAAGSIVFTLPHFLTGPYNSEAAEFDTCDVNRTDVNPCSEEDDEENLKKYYPVFVVAQALHALGASAIYNLGLTHIDENVSSGTAAIYTGVFWTMAVLGPSIGFILGGIYLDIYTDVNVDNIGISPDSPLWVGAWWIGFLVSAGCTFLVAFPLLGFNKRLPGYTEAQKQRRNETRAGTSFQAETKLSNFPKAVFALLKNPTYVLITCGVITEAFMVAFVSVFGPKILESLFNVTASNAALLAGLSITPAGILGPLIGGYIMKRFDFNVSQTLKLCVACLTISGLISLGFLVTCPDVPFAGVTTIYENSTLRYPAGDLFNLTGACNANCQCEDSYDPVCGSDGIMYYSACHAGCTVEDENDDGGVQEYSKCACIPPADDSTDVYGTAAARKCGSDCPYLVTFLVVAFFAFIFTYMVPVPYITATLRCVDYSQRSFALGLQTLFNKGLGVVPGPIAFGALLDRACLLWEYECDDSQNCWLYDNSQITLYLVIMTCTCRLCSIIFFSAALLTYKPPKEEDYIMDQEKKNSVELT